MLVATPDQSSVSELDLDQAVLQYLHEGGYQDALTALEQACGQTYDQSKLQPRHLKRISSLWRQGQQFDAAALVDNVRRTWHGPGYAQKQVQSIEGLHSGANLTSVRWVGKRILSGGADKHIYLCAPWGGKGAADRVRYDAGVVALDVHEPSGLAIAGCMDGTVSLLRVHDALVELQRWRLHKKYAHCVRWHPSGAPSA
jgi:hypothetical protein